MGVRPTTSVIDRPTCMVTPISSGDRRRRTASAHEAPIATEV
jgi:hypothetical protein